MSYDLPVAESLLNEPPEILGQDPVERRQAIDKRRIEMLVAMERPPRFVGGESEDVAGDQRRVGAANVDEGMMRVVVHQAPHVGAPAAEVKTQPRARLTRLLFE